MILNRKYYSKVSMFKAWWYRRGLRKLSEEKVFKLFRLHRTEWPQKLYFYSPRLKRVPKFIGSAAGMKAWPGVKSLEEVCPTNAITVTDKEIIISERGCIACGLCIEAAPEGLLEMPSEVFAVTEDLSTSAIPVKSSESL